ncbi:GNAT family N-acetyltransferase, partial [Streptomyces sp. NPDC057540]|uniref:GNAT family N-acetyltransferase n=1 Tax=Streptomyces sp. NPDC057540 TaxID=3346160 RepID=UPI00367872B5
IGECPIDPHTLALHARRAELHAAPGLGPRLGDEVVASVRARLDEDGTVRIAKLIVHPRMRRHGLGGRLLDGIERHFAAATAPATASAKRFQLFTGHRSEGNLRLYRSKGYAQVSTRELGPRLTLVTLEKAA